MNGEAYNDLVVQVVKKVNTSRSTTCGLRAVKAKINSQRN